MLGHRLPPGRFRHGTSSALGSNKGNSGSRLLPVKRQPSPPFDERDLQTRTEVTQEVDRAAHQTREGITAIDRLTSTRKLLRIMSIARSGTARVKTLPITDQMPFATLSAIGGIGLSGVAPRTQENCPQRRVDQSMSPSRARQFRGASATPSGNNPYGGAARLLTVTVRVRGRRP